MAEVKVGENESIESALRRFKKKIQKAGILSEVKKRERYEKPSAKANIMIYIYRTGRFSAQSQNGKVSGKLVCLFGRLENFVYICALDCPKG